DFNNNDYDTIAQLMASMIVGDSGKNLVDDHFDKMATILLKGVILFVCSEGNLKERNICTVADLIHTVPLDELCEQMAKKTDVAGGLISKIGLQFLNNPNDKEKGSILSTAQRVSGFLENENIKKTLIKSDFNIFDIPNELMSVYLIIEQDKIRDFSAYIRVFFSLALSSLISHKDKHKYEVLFLLDEIAQLGYMDIIAKAPAFIRGMGGQMWFFFQSYPQLQNYYGKMADDILNNSTQIFYGCNDIKTSELISKTLGQRTIKEWEGSSGKYHWIAKDLMTSDEVRRSSPENPIVFMTSKPPIKVKRLNYLKDHEYRGKFDKNPYFG
ncbi:MAG: type IV secretory system conjugative DNA transfer family protein, partial [Odoribacter sp.]|nr:type IV secretory system conjugative DNA transfer family protein [Odoribacter sp.]